LVYLFINQQFIGGFVWTLFWSVVFEVVNVCSAHFLYYVVFISGTLLLM